MGYMKLESQLITVLQQAFLSIYHFSLPKESCNLQVTPKEFQGNFSLPLFPYAKPCKEAAAPLAEKIGQWLVCHANHLVAAYQAVGGFLNIAVQDSIWCAILKEIAANAQYGIATHAIQRQHIVIEFSCPNTNKPQHLGHLRNNFLGGALANLLAAIGHRVDRVNLINDRGIHICKSMVAYKEFGDGETPTSSATKGDHLVGKYYVQFEQQHQAQLEGKQHGNEKNEARGKRETTPILAKAQQMLVDWENEDPEVMALWKQLNGWVYEGFEQTYRKLGIFFDKIYYESDTYKLGKTIVGEGLDKNIFYPKVDGTIAVDLHDLGEKILLRGDGTALYITQDLGTADLRYADYHFDKMIYVVADEQIYHFKVLFAIMQRLDRPYAAAIYHLPYGMVYLPDGKMKSREGKVVDADHLIAEMVDLVKHYTENSHKLDGMPQEMRQTLYQTLAIGALKFFLLRVTPQKKIVFNQQESIDFQGDTGTFIQYTYARIRSMERKATGLPMAAWVGHIGPLSRLEQELIFQLYSLPAHIREAAQSYMPSVVANYALALAKSYSQFYATYPILRASDPATRSFRLLLSSCIAQALKTAMALLTIELPERM